MKCIVYAKEAFLTVNSSEIVILKHLRRVGASALKFRFCTLCCFNLCLFEREQGKCYPTLPNSAFEDKGSFGGQ